MHTESGGAVVDRSTLTEMIRMRVHQLDSAADAEGLALRHFRTERRPLDVLVHQARTLLRVAPGGLGLAEDQLAPHHALLRWRWLTLRLPSALLICAAWLDAPAEPPARVNLLGRDLAPRGPLAHLHVHQGNMADFERVWVGLARFGLPLNLRTESEAAPDGVAPANWSRLLGAAFVARRLLFAALGARGGWPTLSDATMRVWSEPRWHAPARQAIDLLRNSDTATLDAAELNSLIQFVPDGPPPHTEPADGPPTHPMLSGECADERRLLRYLLARLHGAAGDAPEAQPWRKLLLAYLRVKITLFTHLTHDPLVPTLTAFIRTYDRFRAYERHLRQRGLVAARLAASEAPSLPLRAQELREGPPTSVADLKASLKAADAYKREHRVETTLTYHLIRNLGSGGGWAAQRNALNRSVSTLESALDEWPQSLLPRVRALDLACNERKGPLWIAAPILRRLRRQSDRLARIHAVPTLALTLHAGEDDHHLISGLRAIDETITWNLLRPGERIGHAFAMGIDLEAWLRNNPVMSTVPLYVRLLDLAWLLRAAQRLTSPIVLARTRAWEAEASRLLRDHLGLTPEGCSMQSLIDLWAVQLHDCQWQARAFDRDHQPSSDLAGLFMRWLRSAPETPAPASALDTRISVNAAEDGPALLEVRRDLLQRLANMRITIEVNPTSNMLIGGLDRPLDQPMFRLHPLVPATDGTGDPVVAVCLNADDPLAFATTLSDEFAYTWAGLMAAGQPPAVIADWLDRAAAASWRARFGAPQRD